MPDIEKEKRSTSVAESTNRLLMDAYDLMSQTTACIQARSRQALIVTGGAVAGGIKDIPVELAKDPWAVAGKVAAAAGTGAIFAAAAVEAPVLASAATAAATVGTGIALWDSYKRLSKNEKLKQSLRAVYKSGDSHTMLASLNVASDIIGPEAFEYGIAMVGMKTGAHTPDALSNLCDKFYANKLSPYIPIGEVTAFRSIEMRFADGSSLHMHRRQAVFRIGNAEYKLNVLSRNGVDLGMEASYMGRQVLKGHTGTNPIEIDINPLTGITKVKDGQTTIEYKHVLLAGQRLPFFSRSCDECRPFRQSIEESKRLRRSEQ